MSNIPPFWLKVSKIVSNRTDVHFFLMFCEAHCVASFCTKCDKNCAYPLTFWPVPACRRRNIAKLIITRLRLRHLRCGIVKTVEKTVMTKEKLLQK